MLSIIIPANNEEGYIGTCLTHLLASEDPGGPVQVIVVANGCSDDTVGEAKAKSDEFSKRGWRLDVLDLPEGGKIRALNAGDRAAIYDRRIYLDADIVPTPPLISALAKELARSEPSFAGGTLMIPSPRSFISRRYSRFWLRLPFFAHHIHGCGVYAVNAAGRKRWREFPSVIADDGFARLQFELHEMHGAKAAYSWPITEGFANLVRVRRRQDEGSAEIRRLYPELAARAVPTAPSLGQKIGLALRDPIGFAVYSAVAIAVRLPVFKTQSRWYRGR